MTNKQKLAILRSLRHNRNVNSEVQSILKGQFRSDPVVMKHINTLSQIKAVGEVAAADILFGLWAGLENKGVDWEELTEK